LWAIWTTDPLRSIGALIVPLAIVLIGREWRQSGWELQGTWWGVIPLTFSYISVVGWPSLFVSWHASPLTLNLLPRSFSLYLYASGVVLLFAGSRVWRRAWFPLALLLFAQPVPAAFTYQFDYPLQSLSARTARAFAAMIGFSPGNQELLRLVFTPSFGMFIAPGCDGMRGSVALGYAALIAGYIKRLPLRHWLLYVSGGVLLGHLLNLIRLCTLVLYYRVAVGHRVLEDSAKAADYLIGGILFFIAVALFLVFVFKAHDSGTSRAKVGGLAADVRTSRPLVPKIAAFSVIGLCAAAPVIIGIRYDQYSNFKSKYDGLLKPNDLDNLLPKHFGGFQLKRVWQEEKAGSLAIESAAYRTPTSDEVTLGIWLLHQTHNAHNSWITHGEVPESRAERQYLTFQGRVVSFDTAFYTDGITDRLAGTVDCTPAFCRSNTDDRGAVSLSFFENSDFRTNGARAVSIFFSVERPHNGRSKDDSIRELSAEAQDFLSEVDFGELSRRFQ